MKKYIYLLGICIVLMVSACQKLDRDFITTIGLKEIEQSFASTHHKHYTNTQQINIFFHFIDILNEFTIEFSSRRLQFW